MPDSVDVTGATEAAPWVWRAIAIVDVVDSVRLMEFADEASALAVARAMQRRILSFSQGRPADQCIEIRIGLHAASVLIDPLDVFGTGVNMAARLGGLGGPGEIVMSDSFRAAVESKDPFDDVHDLGLCYVKSIEHRARLCAGDLALVRPYAGGLGDVRRRRLVGVQGQLPGPRPPVGPGRAACHSLELVDTATEQLIWAGRQVFEAADLPAPDEALTMAMAADIAGHVAIDRLCHSRTAILSTLSGNELQISAATLMFQAVAETLARAQMMLEHLIERHAREPSPRAWSAMW